MRLALVAVLTGLLAAPELMALARFRDLYTLRSVQRVHRTAAHAVTAANAITWPVLVLGLLGLIMGHLSRQRQATAAAAAALLLYLALTATLVLFRPRPTQRHSWSRPDSCHCSDSLHCTWRQSRSGLSRRAAVSRTWALAAVVGADAWARGPRRRFSLDQARPHGGLSLDLASPVIPPV